MNILTSLYLWLCQRLYHQLAWQYDWISWLVSFGHWVTWQQLVFAYLPPGPGMPTSTMQAQHCFAAPPDLMPDVAISRPVEPQDNAAFRVLELGFGTGDLLIEIAQRGIDVYGLEFSATMQQVTASKLQTWAYPLPRVQAPAQVMPFADQTFDYIVATFPAPYILAPATLHECRRLLRPGEATQVSGKLIIVGLWVDLNNTLLSYLLPFFYGSPSETTLQTIVQRLESAGFTATVSEHQSGEMRVGVIVAESAR